MKIKVNLTEAFKKKNEENIMGLIVILDGGNGGTLDTDSGSLSNSFGRHVSFDGNDLLKHGHIKEVK